jgi:hypothetical protein
MQKILDREQHRHKLAPLSLSEFLFSDALSIGFSSLVPGPSTKYLYALWEHSHQGLPFFLADLEKALCAIGKRHFHICFELAANDEDSRRKYSNLWKAVLSDPSGRALRIVQDRAERASSTEDATLTPRQLAGLLDIARRRNIRFTAEVLDREVDGLRDLHISRIEHLDENINRLYRAHSLTSILGDKRLTSGALLAFARDSMVQGIELCRDFHASRNASVAARVKTKLKDSRADAAIVVYGHEHLEIPFLNRLEPGTSLIQTGVGNSMSSSASSLNFFGFQGKIVDMLGAAASAAKIEFPVEKLDDALFDTLVGLSMQWIRPPGYDDRKVIAKAPQIQLARNVIYRFLSPEQRRTILHASAKEFERLGDVPHIELFAQHLQRELQKELLLPKQLALASDQWRGADRQRYALDARFKSSPLVDLVGMTDHFTRGLVAH